MDLQQALKIVEKHYNRKTACLPLCLSAAWVQPKFAACSPDLSLTTQLHSTANGTANAAAMVHDSCRFMQWFVLVWVQQGRSDNVMHLQGMGEAKPGSAVGVLASAGRSKGVRASTKAESGESCPCWAVHVSTGSPQACVLTEWDVGCYNTGRARTAGGTGAQQAMRGISRQEESLLDISCMLHHTASSLCHGAPTLWYSISMLCFDEMLQCHGRLLSEFPLATS